jgi:hypothetical protein
VYRPRKCDNRFISAAACNVGSTLPPPGVGVSYLLLATEGRTFKDEIVRDSVMTDFTSHTHTHTHTQRLKTR